MALVLTRFMEQRDENPIIIYYYLSMEKWDSHRDMENLLKKERRKK